MSQVNAPLSALPGVNAAVLLTAAGWLGEARSRVEDVADDRLVVAAPSRVRGKPVTVRRSDPIVVRWTTQSRLCEVDAELVEAQTRPVALWDLAIVAPPRSVQRRSGFRLALARSVRLVTESGDGVARSRDLSESGIACVPPDDLRLAVGETVTVHLELDGDALELSAEVVRSDADGLVALAFFGVSEREADRVRAFLFAEQLAQRRREAGSALVS